MTIERLRASLADRYRIERELGQGGMATVYLAQDLKHDRKVAVKVLRPELAAVLGAERFLAEIRVTAKLQHPNLLPLFDSGEADGFLYYVMPFVEGETLRARLLRERQLPVDETVRLVTLLANALDYAHAQGVIHRDLKPENILLQAGQPVIADFGIALAVAHAGGSRVTETGLSLGTPHYMSPEQAAGDRELDAKSDQYALGAVAYEMLTGEPPHTGPTAQAIIARLMTEKPRSVRATRPGVPVAMDLAIGRALAKPPADRFPTCGAVARALVSSPARRSRGLLIGTIVAALVVIAGAAWLATSRMSAAHVEDAKSIAVLPLANLSGDQADDYFGIGLAEEITRAVAKNGVRVIGRVSAGALQAKGLDERAIARELGVNSLLTGTVQRADGQVRINVTLVSAADGAVRWTEKYDRPLANVFAVQDEIARTVAATLLGSLGRPLSATSTEPKPPTPRPTPSSCRGWCCSTGAAPDPAPGDRPVRARGGAGSEVRPGPGIAGDGPGRAPGVRAGQHHADRDQRGRRGRARHRDGLDHRRVVHRAGLRILLAGRPEPGRGRASAAPLALDSTVATTWGWYGLLANRLGDYRVAHERIARARGSSRPR